MMLAPMLALAAVLAQAPLAAPPQQGQGEALRVFLDCQWQCDEDYLRTEITFVNYVRDRTLAQLHVLVTTQGTGGGGREFTLTFIGLRDFAGRTDTLRYVSRQADTNDEIRRGFARILRLGLVRYTAGTPLAEHLDVRYTPPSTRAASAREQRDPWNYWVFRSSVNGNFRGEQRRSSNSWNGSLSASRTTEEWKISLRASKSEYRQRSEYPIPILFDSAGNVVAESTVVNRSTRRSWSGTALAARSLGAHWSAGVNARISGSTYSNLRRLVWLAPAVEYDVFPYTQSTRQLFTVNYSLGPEWADYQDTTLYGKTAEGYLVQRLDVSLSLQQPWGRAYVGVNGTNYLLDVGNPNISLFGNLEVRVVRGLSLNGWGSYSFVRSQRHVSAATLTPADVLLELRAMRTDYQFQMGFGLSYQFGSAYNNVVNPRFGGGGGMMFF